MSINPNILNNIAKGQSIVLNEQGNVVLASTSDKISNLWTKKIDSTDAITAVIDSIKSNMQNIDTVTKCKTAIKALDNLAKKSDSLRNDLISLSLKVTNKLSSLQDPFLN